MKESRLILPKLLLIVSVWLVASLQSCSRSTPPSELACISNLRMIRGAAIVYSTKYGGFPSAAKPGPSEEAKLSESMTKGYQYIQLLVNSRILDKPDVLICPSSKDGNVSPKVVQGSLVLGPKGCSYLWTTTSISPTTPKSTPLAADKEDFHMGCRHVVFLGGAVRKMSEEEFLKEVQPKLTVE